MAETKTVAQNTTLEVVGIGALSTGIIQISTGQLIEGIAIAAIGISALVLKYFKRD